MRPQELTGDCLPAVSSYYSEGEWQMIENAVEMKHITMAFPEVVANDDVSFSVRKGEIHALVGENGAGKSTLMNVLYGLLQPTKGEIFIHGEKKAFHSALQAIESGIGMVHQHFMLIHRLSVAENMVLGAEPRKGKLIDREEAYRAAQELSDRYGFHLDPKAKVADISLSAMQKVEIAKALYREADILILDEPTGVLTPQEIDELGAIIKELKKIGKSIIIITHKLKEVMAFSDRITVLRAGKVVKTLNTGETNADEVTELMVGHDVSLDRKRKEKEDSEVILEFRNVSYKDKLKNASFCVHAGEIVGIAGIDGNGQKELTELAAGILKPTEGQIFLDGKDISSYGIRESKKAGIGFVPQDRQRSGLVLRMPVWENLLIGYQREQKYRKGILMNAASARKEAERQIGKFDIRPASDSILAGNLSGGNQQKVVVAREADRAGRLIVADQPSRGVDVGAIELIYNIFNELCEEGKGALVSSLELDELMSISDRIIVLAEGKISGIVDGKTASRYEIGALMLKQEDRA